MKTKEKILKMSALELGSYKWSSDLNVKGESLDCTYCTRCTRCTYCTRCTRCTDCTGCTDCYMCRNARDLRYAICNIEMTKEEYETKMMEING
jgi:hypothetical protein